MKRIILDIDGVLADFNHSAANLIESMFGVEIDRSMPWPVEWDWIKAAIGEEREIEFWRTVHDNPDWFAMMPVCDDVVPLIADGSLVRLASTYDVYAVTSRRPHLREVSEYWIYAMTGAPIPVITVAGPKGPLVKAIGADLLVDDKPEHVESALAAGVEALLISRPWNESSALERSTLGTVVAALGLEFAQMENDR